MKEYDIQTPSGVRVSGRLVASDDPRDLSQDMAEVVLRNGITICVGWNRDCVPGGAYLIEVISGLKDVVPPIAESNVFDALQTIAILISRFQEQSFATSDTGSTDLKLSVAA